MLCFENEYAAHMYIQLRLLGSKISGTNIITEKLAREVLRSTEAFHGCTTVLKVLDNHEGLPDLRHEGN